MKLTKVTIVLDKDDTIFDFEFGDEYRHLIKVEGTAESSLPTMLEEALHKAYEWSLKPV